MVKRLHVESAKSGNSQCRICYKRIEKNEIRVSTERGRAGPHFLWKHLKCFRNLQMKRAKSGEIIFSLDNVCYMTDRQTHSKIIEKALKPVVKTYKKVLANYKLDKRVEDMNVKELKQALNKRDLSPSGNKSALKQRLIDYFQTKLCLKIQRKNNEKLIKGYLRILRQKTNMNIPICLQNMIISHYPTITL